MTKLPERDTIEAAVRAVYAAMPPTPQYVWPQLVRALGTEVWLKHENHTPTGAFKVRGGLTYFAHLRQQLPGCRGVIGATKGNHGQSLGYAAGRVGMRCVVVVPHGNSREKNAAMQSLGVELIEFGHDFQAAREHASMSAKQDALHFVPSFHIDLVAGVATYWAELFKAGVDLDAVYVPIGQGSGICACVVARDAFSPGTRIIGVISAHARCCGLSLAAGRSIDSPVTTLLADGLACRIPDDASLDVIRKSVERVIEVTDDEVAAAMRLLYTATHNVAEGAGAASLAGALQERASLAGRKVGVTLTGGNVDADLFVRVLRNESFASSSEIQNEIRNAA